MELAARRAQQEEAARLEALNKPIVNDQTMVLSKHTNDATVNLGQIPTTPLNMKNKPLSTSYELTPHGSDKVNIIIFISIYHPVYRLNFNGINSVKPFKSKNCDKIDLDAQNPNLKKGSVEIFEQQPNL